MLARLEAESAQVTVPETPILALERSLSAIRIEEVQAQERLDSYKYPVLTLPSEIVSEIFIHFLPIYPLCPPLTGILSPTLLTRICRQWREISLATPMLWRAISCHYNDIPVERQVQILIIWLRRSRGCPLSIQIDHETRHVPEILAAAIPHLARWDVIKLHLSPSHFPTINCPMPLLRELHLSLEGDPDPDVIAFGEAPQLRTVILEGYATTLSVNLPWTQLASLTLDGVYRSEYVVILPRTPNLRRCKLVIIFEFNDATPPHDITLRYLDSLTLDIEGELTPTHYPDIFLVPALRTLRISEPVLGPSPIDALTSFLSKSGCKPRKVHIGGERSFSRRMYRDAFPTMSLKFSFDDEASEDNLSDCASSHVTDDSQQ
ncbi:hypothetical protein B0H13DRAFT_1700924 [Mycena leptocephala]|nr:hypothetical protein B0H13DRAFT_1700924 [Mycena leptocephala]